MAVERVIIAVIISSSLITMASAIAGTANYYTSYVPSACYGDSDQGTMIAAANNRAACGRRYNVRCTGGTNNAVPNPCWSRAYITVKIVDVCSGCGPNQLQLSLEAFKMIGNTNAGTIRIDYTPA